MREPLHHLAYPLHHMFAREFDIAQGVLRLILGGVLEAFPRLTFLIDHYGGGVSTVIDRLDQYWNGYDPNFRMPFYFDQPLISRPWREYFNMLYFGMAGRGTSTDTLKMCLVNIRPDKMMYATDWPFLGENRNLGRDLIANVRALDLPSADIDGILGGNAARVFGVSR